ncbi:MAG: hypothetical protein AAB464_02245 [Patescibacteria group bacterium]
MKRKIILFFFFLIISPSLALAEDEWWGKDWTNKDTAREVVYSALHIADWGQTRYIAKNPQKFYERNPLLGKHPSVGKVDTYFFGGLVAHAAISYILPPKYRWVWQYVGIGMEGGAVAHNASIGIKFEF